MGNRVSFKRERSESRKEHIPGIPEITVIRASPLPAEGSMFTLPGPVQTGPAGLRRAETGSLFLGGLQEAEQTETGSLSLGGLQEAEQTETGSLFLGGLQEAEQTETRSLSLGVLQEAEQTETGSLSLGGLQEAEQTETGSLFLGVLQEAEQTETRSLSLGVLQEAEQTDSEGFLRQQHSDEVDSRSWSGSEGASSPTGSRKHFIQVMMSSSPQVRRSMVLRRSVYLAGTVPSRSDCDSASLDEDRTAVALDPLEHEWMMCASDGEWDSLNRLLATEPGLLLRKDFVTGFTCLHWAAKQGKPELIALIANFAKRHNVPVSVDVRSNTGYTPLHVAAMHGHMEVVKLLVGAYGADVEVRDHGGRKACQYLTDNVSVDIRDIIGAYESSESQNQDRGDGGRWRFSKVLQSNLKPLRLLSPNDRDSVDGGVRPRDKVLRRKSSLSRMKPKLQKLRLRTSQIVHSTTFRDTEEQEGSGKGSFKSRPKTHFFG